MNIGRSAGQHFPVDFVRLSGIGNINGCHIGSGRIAASGYIPAHVDHPAVVIVVGRNHIQNIAHKT